MNYLTFIEQIMKYNSVSAPNSFLVSGNDKLVCNYILSDIYRKAYHQKKHLIIIDDSKNMDSDILEKIGYCIKNGLSGEYSFYPFFQVELQKEMSRIRQVLDCLNYDEKQKQKLIAYFNLVKYMEGLSKKKEKEELTIDVLSEYSSNLFVKKKLQQMVEDHSTNEEQQLYLLGKYSEICDIAPDFENDWNLLEPYIMGNIKPFAEKNVPTAFLLPFRELENDIVMKQLALQMLSYCLEDAKKSNIAVVILDKGSGERSYLLKFISELPIEVEHHLISEDIFTFDDNAIQIFSNQFAVKIYSRHNAMASCSSIERVLGEIDVVKSAYSVNYDRRWKNNSPFDVLTRNNKTETYTWSPAIREPKYRKEMIISLFPNNGIVEFMGRSCLFSLK